MYREKARAQLGDRELMFSLSQGQASRFDPAEWREFVELAHEFGATHVEMGWLPFRYGTWFLPDNDDPYASWCNAGLGLFRAFPPEALQEWIPVAEAQEVQGILDAQVAELRRFGLKAAVSGCEPLWLPEEVYRAHPSWRGAQCELGRIARRPYFAPSIDEPEVLELYRQAMRELATRYPEVDQFSFMANDSGSGLSWAPCIYPGMNGPSRWRKRDPGERLAGWLEAMQDGAAEAGVQVRLNAWSSGLPAAWVATSRIKLREGLFVNWGSDATGEAWQGSGASLGGGLWGPAYPVLGICEPAAFIGSLQAVYNNPKNDKLRCSIGVGPERLGLARTLLETFLDKPASGLVGAAQVQVDAACRLTGSPELAERLVTVWDGVRMALHSLGQVRQKGFSIVLPWACVTMRWLVRPLVPQPESLTPEESASWREFLFSVNSDVENADFGNVLGKMVFKGSCVAWMVRWALQDTISRLGSASSAVETIASKADSAYEPELRLYATRLKALSCLVATVKNAVLYQYALDTMDQPQYGPNMMDYDDNMVYDQRALALRKIAREEVDNTAELLGLLHNAPGRVLEYARTPEEESVFMLGPEVVADLEKKLAIMLDHWQEYEELFPSCKMHDFEPSAVGNIAEESLF